MIEYPTGYQIRVYTQGVVGYAVEDPYPGVDWIDYINGDVHLKDDYRVPVDTWLYGCPIDDVSDLDVINEMEAADAEEEAARKAAESLRVAASRAKQTLYYLARSNVWEWFITLTVAPSDKIDRYNYDDVSKKSRQWLNNLRKLKAPDMYYLIVPEQHKDGAWHMHGLIGGSEGLSFVDSGHVDDAGNRIYNLDNWRYGFSTATKVQDTRRVSSYISKYITKSLVAASKGKHRFWASKNCKRAVVEDYLLDGVELHKYRQLLLEHMHYKTAVDGEFFRVEFFELPLESDLPEPEGTGAGGSQQVGE